MESQLPLQHYVKTHKRRATARMCLSLCSSALNCGSRSDFGIVRRCRGWPCRAHGHLPLRFCTYLQPNPHTSRTAQLSTREKRRRTPLLVVATTSAYLWLAQVVAHGQMAQSAALPGRIDARRDGFTVPTAKSAQWRV